jgi:hypothetical protein
MNITHEMVSAAIKAYSALDEEELILSIKGMRAALEAAFAQWQKDQERNK